MTSKKKKNAFLKYVKGFIFSEDTATYTLSVCLVIVFVAVILYLVKGSFELNVNDVLDEEKIGQFGDFIGGFIGSIFSLLGVILFYVALTEQRKDFARNQTALKLQLQAFQQQVKEFEAQKIELSETRKIYEQQNKTMKVQQFDSNFYSLLNVFRQQRDDFNKKRIFFRDLCVELKNRVNSDGGSFVKRFENSCFHYVALYHENQEKLSLYFMSVYRLVKIINTSENLTELEKESYHKIVRSLLSKEELLLLYYNYQSAFGKKPLPIILKHDYLKHLSILDKVEFSQFDISKKYTVHANEIVARLCELARRNLVDAMDLENMSETREEITLSKGIIAGVYVDVDFVFKLYVNDEGKIPFDFDEDKFMLFLSCVLLDIFYHSKFRKVDLSKQSKSKVRLGSQTIHVVKLSIN